MASIMATNTEVHVSVCLSADNLTLLLVAPGDNRHEASRPETVRIWPSGSERPCFTDMRQMSAVPPCLLRVDDCREPHV